MKRPPTDAQLLAAIEADPDRFADLVHLGADNRIAGAFSPAHEILGLEPWEDLPEPLTEVVWPGQEFVVSVDQVSRVLAPERQKAMDARDAVLKAERAKFQEPAFVASADPAKDPRGHAREQIEHQETVRALRVAHEDAAQIMADAAWKTHNDAHRAKLKGKKKPGG